MTPAEDLLSSLLAQEAAAITPESVRPLTGPGEARQGAGGHQGGGSRLKLLASVTAGVSVLAAVGLIVAAGSAFTTAAPFANLGTAAAPPRYYVVIDPNDNVVVQSTATGRRTDVVSPPDWIHGNSNADAAVAVSPLGRKYVVDYNDWDELRSSLFEFTITSAGQVSGFAPIRTRRLPGLTEPSLAISPGGSQLALAGIPDKSPSVEPSSGPPRLLVVNLRTGLVRTWPGLASHGAAKTIEDPAWLTDRTLRFMVASCRGDRVWPFNAGCELSGPSATIWTMRIPDNPAQLGAGRPLFRLPGVTLQALSLAGGDSVAALQRVDSGSLRVVSYSVPAGRQLRILYEEKGGAKSNYFYTGMTADGSGQYLLINDDLGAVFGWIGGGRLHRLPVHAPYGNDEVIAAGW